MHSFINMALEKHSHNKNAVVSSRQNQVPSTQNKKKPLLILCRAGNKKKKRLPIAIYFLLTLWDL